MACFDEGEDQKDRDTEGGCSRWHCPWNGIVAFCANNVEKPGSSAITTRRWIPLENSGRFSIL